MILPLVRRAGREHRAPGRGRRVDDLAVPHQQVGAPAVRDAVGLALAVDLDGVPVPVLQVGEDARVVRHQCGVHRRHVAGVDQPEGRVTRGGHHVVLPGVHQRDHLVGGVGDLDVDLAAGGLLERVHPVHRGVVGAVLGVARPGDDVDQPLGRPERAGHGDARRGLTGRALPGARRRGGRAAGGEDQGADARRGDGCAGSRSGHDYLRGSWAAGVHAAPTRRSCSRLQRRRTGRPIQSSSRVEAVARLGWVATSEVPCGVSTSSRTAEPR